jgi:hypothetical protein
MGDVLVLDAMRCPHTRFVLPGENIMDQMRSAMIELRETLPSTLHGYTVDDKTGSAASKIGSLAESLWACSRFSRPVLEPEPYPVVGERYTVVTSPSTLLRKGVSLESDVAAEIRPGSTITILEVSQDAGLVRAKIYTEHATVIMFDSATNGGDFLEKTVGSSMQGGTTGWVSCTSTDGRRLLQPLSGSDSAGKSPPSAVSTHLANISGLIRGICDWVNMTDRALAGADVSRGSRLSRQQQVILDRNKRLLESKLEDMHHLSFEAQCVAVALPGRRNVLMLVVSVFTLLVGNHFLSNKRGQTLHHNEATY